MGEIYDFVAKRAGHRCEYCRAPEVLFTFRFEIDHITPLYKGGRDTSDNWALACRACNLWKADVIDRNDTVTKTDIRLFHPRTDHWFDHFNFKLDESMLIIPATPIGRVTVAQLRLNAPAQLEARKWWMLLGLFP